MDEYLELDIGVRGGHHLKVGEKFQVRLHSRLKNALALVTLEGEGIISYKILPLSDGFNPFLHSHVQDDQRSMHSPAMVVRILCLFIQIS